MINTINIVSDPDDRESIWMMIGGKLAVLFYDGRPLASLNYSELKISDNVASTHGAGVRLTNFKTWLRRVFNKAKLPTANVVHQETLNDELAASFFHHLTLLGGPLADLTHARRLDAEAVSHKEEPIFKDFERNRMENTLKFFEGLRYSANETNLTSNRAEARTLRVKAEKETEKRVAAEKVNREKHQDAITAALAQDPNEGPEDSRIDDETTFSVTKHRDNHPADGM